MSQFPNHALLPPSTDTGKLRVMHLKRYWNKALLRREGKIGDHAFSEEWSLDTTLLSVIGVGLEQVIKYLYREVPSFDEFEDWVKRIAGLPEDQKIEKFNYLVIQGGQAVQPVEIEAVLSAQELKFWNDNGYTIIRGAVSKADCDETIRVICKHIDIERYDASTWYRTHDDRQGIMIQLFQHPILEKNRSSERVRKVYEQLWNRSDIYVNTDRVGFNPPETENFPFQGPRLHWDVSLNVLPVPFGIQGILYLADTAENQGALTLVPGFQNRIDDWISSLPAGSDPKLQDLYGLGAIPIAADAGDFIVWHKALPHGSSPNTNSLPRFVQYFTYMPTDEKDGIL